MKTNKEGKLITITYDPEDVMTLKIDHYMELFKKARELETLKAVIGRTLSKLEIDVQTLREEIENIG